jgi:uncharacterized membrane protein
MSETPLGRLEVHVGRLLLAGLLASAACLAVGLLLTLAGRSGGSTLTTGLVLLMATPILRVILSIVEYVRMRDWLFVAVTVFVLLVLTGTVVAALR